MDHLELMQTIVHQASVIREYDAVIKEQEQKIAEQEKTISEQAHLIQRLNDKTYAIPKPRTQEEIEREEMREMHRDDRREWDDFPTRRRFIG